MGSRRIAGLFVVVFLSAGVALGQEASAPAQSTSPQTPSQPALPPGFVPPPGVISPVSAVPPLVSPNEQGASIFQQSLTTVAGQSPISDVTLTGNIVVMKGGKPLDSGTITLTAIGDTQAEVTIRTASGARTEVRSISSTGTPSEMWTGPDGAVKHNPVQSLLTPHPAWFFPEFVMAAQPITEVGSSFVAAETRNGANVNHLQVWQSPTNTSSVPEAILRSRTQYDLYLDPASALPVAMVFYVQPDYPKPAVVYVPRDTRAPIEMRFSNYQLVQGHTVALHIQAFIQGYQIYDIQLSSAVFNTNPVIASAN